MDHKKVVEIFVPHNSCGGTGYLVQSSLILTSHHILCGYDIESEVKCDIRFLGDIEKHKTEWQSEAATLCWHSVEHDVALLSIKQTTYRRAKNDITPPKLGRLIGGERYSTKAYGYGFPKVQKINNRQNVEIMRGNLSRLAGLRENQLRLELTSLTPGTPSEWSGVSGTSLFVEDCLVGIVVETNKGFNERALWATPISLLANDKSFCQLFFGDTRIQTPELSDIQCTYNSPQNLYSDNVREGEIFKVFSQAPISLRQHIRIKDFESLVEDKTKNFVGREFIFQSIDDLLSDPDFRSGYIVISGEPGIGKSSLIAQLVKTKGAVHHFNNALMSICSSELFLKNICAQLIVQHKLDYLSLPSEASKDSGFLSRILLDISKVNSSTPIVILIDALDEADDTGLPPRSNRLLLPPSLPEGVFFVITSREENDYRLEVQNRKDIYLKDSDPLNLQDVRIYIHEYIQRHREKILPQIERWSVEENVFIDVVSEKSEGNFMYLHHVLHDIKEGKLTRISIDKIQNLPKGLQSYYQRHWREMKMQNPKKFQDYYEPVICQLAVAREPVSVYQLSEWTRLPQIRIKEVIRDWFEFFNKFSLREGSELYRIYHRSFQTFLREEVGLKPYEVNVVNAISAKIQW